MRTASISLRAVFLIAFVIAMPILALPAVARRVDELLYGPAPDEFSQPVSKSTAQQLQVVEPLMVERASPASYDEIDVAATPSRSPHEGLDAVPAALLPLELHPPLTPPAGDRNLADQPLDGAAAARLQDIRQQLEQLGAQYILLETIDGSGQYRFHCQMRLNEQAPYTREFEASGPDPLTVAEQVLRDASRWRAAGAEVSQVPGQEETRRE